MNLLKSKLYVILLLIFSWPFSSHNRQWFRIGARALSSERERYIANLKGVFGIQSDEVLIQLISHLSVEECFAI